MYVTVRDNNVDQALRVLKKKLQREGVFREMKNRRAYEKPSERRAREAAESCAQTDAQADGARRLLEPGKHNRNKPPWMAHGGFFVLWICPPDAHAPASYSRNHVSYSQKPAVIAAPATAL